MSAPPSKVCPQCGGQDYLEPPTPLPDGMWQFVCMGPHGEYEFVASADNQSTAYPSGLAAELGLYDDLPKCITDPSLFVEYGIVEYRYGIAHPKEYAQLVATYGHRSKQTGKSYSASAFIASTLGRLSREGVLQHIFDRGTGYWTYDDQISYWSPPGKETPHTLLTWEEFATNEDLDHMTWPL